MALADAIASINRTLEIVQKRMAAMEEKRAEAESRQAAVLAAMEEKRNSDRQQLLAKMEKLSTAVTEAQRMFEKAAGKQTTHPNPPILPTPPPNPQPITTIIPQPQPPGSSAQISQQPPYENPENPNPIPLLPTPPPTPFALHTVAPSPAAGYGQIVPHSSPEGSDKGVRTPRLEVPVFSGETVDGWLFRLECYFEMNDVRPKQMVRAAPLFLTGEALGWYRDKPLLRRSVLVFFNEILIYGVNRDEPFQHLQEASEANWEFEDVMRNEYPDFNLEDKVVFYGGGNDASKAARDGLEHGKLGLAWRSWASA